MGMVRLAFTTKIGTHGLQVLIFFFTIMMHTL